MTRMIFVNLPVKDLQRSRAFLEALGAVNEPKSVHAAPDRRRKRRLRSPAVPDRGQPRKRRLDR